MVKSMTGYGRAEGYVNGSELTVEVRSLNHRYLEIVSRLPKTLFPLESHIKKVVQEKITRGRVEVVVAVNGGNEATRGVSLDLEMARHYHRVLTDLKKELDLEGKIDVGLLASFRDILTTQEEGERLTNCEKKVEDLLKKALSRCAVMRKKEGEVLTSDLMEKAQEIKASIDRIQRRTPRVIEDYRKRLLARITQITGGREPDPHRIAQEVAILSDRCDIGEEIVRVKSHLAQFRRMVLSREAVGKTLEFLIQELHREVTTISSKANDAMISHEVVAIKGQLEKMREQVQNVE